MPKRPSGKKPSGRKPAEKKALPTRLFRGLSTSSPALNEKIIKTIEAEGQRHAQFLEMINGKKRKYGQVFDNYNKKIFSEVMGVEKKLEINDRAMRTVNTKLEQARAEGKPLSKEKKHLEDRKQKLTPEKTKQLQEIMAEWRELERKKKGLERRRETLELKKTMGLVQMEDSAQQVTRAILKGKEMFFEDMKKRLEKKFTADMQPSDLKSFAARLMDEIMLKAGHKKKFYA